MYESCERISSAGFASLFGEKGELHIGIQVRNVYELRNDEYPVYLLIGEKEMEIGSIRIETGIGNFEKSFSSDGSKVFVKGLKVIPEDIGAVSIRLTGSRVITGEWKHIKQPAQKPEAEKTEKEKTEKEKTESKVIKPKEESEKEPREEPGLKAVSIPSDKWEQLKCQYKTIHPFSDEREFITIEPKDFIVLRESYQKLVNNSFLLHGFYNYRHLILGKDYKIGADHETCFYLGVPGVFFEREKMVAVMFGFEGFEAAGPIEIGKFGYYLRKVEI
ncbi:MAG: DUF6128 domain-containing protein [Suilimivivens sp.]